MNNDMATGLTSFGQLFDTVVTRRSPAQREAKSQRRDAHVARSDRVEISIETVESWVAGIRSRDQSALKAMYEATSSVVYGLALRITRRRELADEVVSDVYVQAWRRIDAYDPERGTLFAWLLIVCRTRALDAIRRETPGSNGPIETRPEHEVAAAPDDLLAATERDTAVRRALLQLSASERQLLSLAFFRGYSHAELADITGLPLGTVKSRLRRSLRALQAHV